MEEAGCGNCRYGREEPRGSVFARDRGAGWGSCRRHPPIVAVVPSPERPGFLQAAYPRVQADDWCGHYQGQDIRISGYIGLD